MKSIDWNTMATDLLIASALTWNPTSPRDLYEGYDLDYSDVEGSGAGQMYVAEYQDAIAVRWYVAKTNTQHVQIHPFSEELDGNVRCYSIVGEEWK